MKSMFFKKQLKLLCIGLIFSLIVYSNVANAANSNTEVKSCLNSQGELLTLSESKANIMVKKCQLELEEKNIIRENETQFWQQESFWQLVALIGAIVAYLVEKSDENRIREEQYKREFKLKAAEIILGARNPHAAKAKAEALDCLFHEDADVEENFAKKFNPYRYQAAISDAMKLEIFKTLLENKNRSIDSIFNDLETIIKAQEEKLENKICEEDNKMISTSDRTNPTATSR